MNPHCVGHEGYLQSVGKLHTVQFNIVSSGSHGPIKFVFDSGMPTFN